MSEYTPEKVAELVAEVRDVGEFLADHEYYEYRLIARLGDALTAVSAERDEEREARRRTTHRYRTRLLKAQADRDRLHKAITEALETAPKLGELRWRNVDRMIGILRAALDKEGNDDE